ncbi:MAG: hypothetical protein [Bacteriophage sp.]|nr:MAG: hypothetical protein [Bacteriophage sp.]
MTNPMFAKFKQAKPFRPMYNVGCLQDIATGRYEKGLKGEWILNGGVAAIEGVTGPGNSLKSTYARFRILMVLMRYHVATGYLYDTENSATLQRIIDLANQLDPSGALSATLDPEAMRYMFTNAEDYNGSEWWDLFKSVCAERIKQPRFVDTPFLDAATGKPYSIQAPMVGEIDSFSQFQTDAVSKKTEKGTVGDSDLNAVAMQNANGKAQLLDMLPSLAAKAGFTMIMSAHMGDTIIMDQYNAPKKKLAFVKANRKMKKVPEPFTFLTNNLFEIINVTPLINRNDKLPEFPLSKQDDLEGNTDLMEVTVLPIRTKSGVTGIPFSLVISQRFGVQPSLTEYYYLKCYDRYGLTGSLVNQRLCLLPDLVFTRNTIRQVIKDEPKFRRAVEILSEMCQIKNLWPDYAASDLPTPEELYEGLKAQGYDWNQLLETRGYWTFDQYTNPIPFLSTKDLIEMYHKRYKPFWM